MSNMETKQEHKHPVITTRTECVNLPNGISVEVTFQGYERDASRLVISNMTSRIVFVDAEQVRMFADAISGLHWGSGLSQPLTDAEKAAKDAEPKAVAS